MPWQAIHIFMSACLGWRDLQLPPAAAAVPCVLRLCPVSRLSLAELQVPWQRTGCLAVPLALWQGRPQGDRPEWPVDGLIGWVMKL